MSDALAYFERKDSRGGKSAEVPCGGNPVGINRLSQFGSDVEDVSSLPLMALACNVVKRRNPRRIIFNDKPIIELVAMDASCFTRQTLPTGFFPFTRTGRQIVVDGKYISNSDHSIAVARSKALDLLTAWVVGHQEVLPLMPTCWDEDTYSEFVATDAVDQSCDALQRVLFWRHQKTLMFGPAKDGYASYGRPWTHWLEEQELRVVDVDEMSKGFGDSSEHYGELPKWALAKHALARFARHVYGGGPCAAAAAAPKASNVAPFQRATIHLSSPSHPALNGKVVEPPWYVASLAEGTIKLWLIDT